MAGVFDKLQTNVDLCNRRLNLLALSDGAVHDSNETALQAGRASKEMKQLGYEMQVSTFHMTIPPHLPPSSPAHKHARTHTLTRTIKHTMNAGPRGSALHLELRRPRHHGPRLRFAVQHADGWKFGNLDCCVLLPLVMRALSLPLLCSLFLPSTARILSNPF